MSAGGLLGHGWDAYGSFAYLDFDGTRENNDQELLYGYGNLGYRWNEDHETRLHLDIQDLDYQLPSSLTQAQLEDDPGQSNDLFDNPPSGFPVYRVDLRHTLRLPGGGRFDAGAYYFYKDFSFLFRDFGFFRDTWEDAGFNLRSEIPGRLFGRENRVIFGGLAQWMWIKDREFQPVNGEPAFKRFQERDEWNNVEAYVEDQLRLSDAWTLVAGAQFAYRKVSYEHEIPPLALGQEREADQDFSGFNPKLGFTWQAHPAAQIYANVSRSFEPPRLSDLRNVFQVPELASQTGTTVEIGTRGGTESLSWDLAFYHAWLDEEILVIPLPPTFTTFTTTNADHTLHTGIELGLESTLSLGLLHSGDNLRLRGTYTWNDFRFDGDLRLGDNRLPGIPQHVGQFELLYRHPSGLYAGPNVQAASANLVDFTNTLEASSYALLGARIGWDDGRHWKLFLDGRNLTDEHYAASVFVTGDARGQDRAQFNPGATRLVFSGVEFRW